MFAGPVSAAIDNDGGILAMVEFSDGADLDPGPGESLAVGKGIAITKFSEAGTVEWVLPIRRSSESLGVAISSLALLQDGFVIVGTLFSTTAVFEGTAGAVTRSAGPPLCFIARYDSQRRVSVQTLGGSSPDSSCYAYTVLPFASGFAVAGSIQGEVASSSGQSFNAGAESDAYLALMRMDGTFSSVQLFPSTGKGVQSSGASGKILLPRVEGGAWLIGTHWTKIDLDPGPGVFVRDVAESQQIFGVAVDNSANFVEGWSLEGSGLDLNGATTTSSGHIVLSGGVGAGKDGRWIDLDPSASRLVRKDVTSFLMRLSGAEFVLGKAIPSNVDIRPIAGPGGQVIATGTFGDIVDFGEIGGGVHVAADGRLFVGYLDEEMNLSKLTFFGSAASGLSSIWSSTRGFALLGYLIDGLPTDLHPGSAKEIYSFTNATFVSRYSF
ncbi:MAG: hypothetical protein KA712_02735 [Myxococcales bacterium]|nr:hypothetical protein [Myxococcales bacterium]